MLKIHITQPTSAEHYGAMTQPEEALICARNCLALAEAYARKHWPDAEITSQLVEETQSIGNRSWAYDYTAPTVNPQSVRCCEEIIEAIDIYIGNNWVEDPLWETEFDAEAYLAKNPR